jgi:enoyl-CoA hydratase
MHMVERQFVRLDHDGPISTLTVARPDRMNALDAQVLDDIGAAVREVADRAEARCLLVTGEGKAFVAGADIAAMRGMSPEQARAFAQRGHAVFDALETLRVPAIAAVNGFALGGGCELALACDFIYASDKARFGQPEVKLGIIPGFGGTQRLARRVGPGVARELIYSGAMIDAAEALRIGLANRVLAPDALLPTARETASAIAAAGPLAVAAAKRVIRDGVDQPLPGANALEVEAFGELFSSEDTPEGMGAFLDKRAPKFQGR